MDQPLRQPSAPESPTADSARRLLELLRVLVVETQRSAPPAIELDSRLVEDLGIDSLARVELNLRCEEALGRRLDDAQLAAVATPREILAALRLAPAAQAVRLVVAEAPSGMFAGSPDDAATLAQVLDWHVARHPQRVHVTLIVDDEHVTTLTYGELQRRALRASAALVQAGLLLVAGRLLFGAYIGHNLSMAFTDEAVVFVRSGRGGAGSASFHSEPYKPRGGPDGGDGGDGGSIVLQVASGVRDLSDLAAHPHRHADDGKPGRNANRNGGRAKDLVIPVPDGTVV